MTKIGGFFKILGLVVYIIIGIWAFIVDLSIINQAAGFWGVVGAFILAPFVFVAAPFYALVEYGNLFPLILTYGGIIPALILYGIGELISRVGA